MRYIRRLIQFMPDNSFRQRGIQCVHTVSCHSVDCDTSSTIQLVRGIISYVSNLVIGCDEHQKKEREDTNHWNNRQTTNRDENKVCVIESNTIDDSLQGLSTRSQLSITLWFTTQRGVYISGQKAAKKQKEKMLRPVRVLS